MRDSPCSRTPRTATGTSTFTVTSYNGTGQSSQAYSLTVAATTTTKGPPTTIHMWGTRHQAIGGTGDSGAAGVGFMSFSGKVRRHFSAEPGKRPFQRPAKHRHPLTGCRNEWCAIPTLPHWVESGHAAPLSVPRSARPQSRPPKQWRCLADDACRNLTQGFERNQSGPFPTDQVMRTFTTRSRERYLSAAMRIGAKVCGCRRMGASGGWFSQPSR